MKIFKFITIFIVIVVFGIFGYFYALGFSTGLPYPEFMESKLRSGGAFSPLQYWGFVVVTLSLPYSLGVAVVSFVGARYSTWWVPVFAISLALLYIRNLTFSPWYWFTLFLGAVLVSIASSALGVKWRNKHENTALERKVNLSSYYGIFYNR